VFVRVRNSSLGPGDIAHGAWPDAVCVHLGEGRCYTGVLSPVAVQLEMNTDIEEVEKGKFVAIAEFLEVAES
jgi:hypothetical protein